MNEKSPQYGLKSGLPYTLMYVGSDKRIVFSGAARARPSQDPRRGSFKLDGGETERRCGGVRQGGGEVRGVAHLLGYDSALGTVLETGGAPG